MSIKIITVYPFIKWVVGGKRSIINELMQRILTQYFSYHEPFLDGEAFFVLSSLNVFL